MSSFSSSRRISVATTRTSSTRFERLDRSNLPRGERIIDPGQELESRTASTELRQSDVRLGGTAESVQERQDEIALDIIDERNEILEESGGRSEETDVIGEDPNQPALEIKSTLSVLYGFAAEYTSDGFLQSFSPIFEKISKGRNGRARARTQKAARDSVLIARMKFKVGRQEIDDYKALTQIAEPELNISTRAYLYSDKEQGILQDIISQSRMDKNDMLNVLSNSLQIPEYEETETTIIVNKLQLEGGFRLSPIEDEPISPREQPDRSRTSEDEDSGEEAIGPGDRSVQQGFDPRFELPESDRPERPPRGPTLGGGTFRDTSLIEEADLVRRFATETHAGHESTTGKQTFDGARGGYQSGD